MTTPGTTITARLLAIASDHEDRAKRARTPKGRQKHTLSAEVIRAGVDEICRLRQKVDALTGPGVGG